MTGIEFKGVSYTYPETEKVLFTGLDLSLPDGVVSLVGQNGTGKSTLLLLAAGNILPDIGTVRICGENTANLRDENERQRWVSLIFQNMEFETEEDIGNLLPFVYDSGFHERKDQEFIKSLIDIFELDGILNKKTQEISKGELQRAILVFSLLYGSKVLLMDEPIFAMEPYQREGAMEFLTSYARDNGIPLYYSVHELDITEKYSDHVLLFYKDQRLRLGKPAEMLQREVMEEAYEFPQPLLKKKESLYRDLLVQLEVKKRTGGE